MERKGWKEGKGGVGEEVAVLFGRGGVALASPLLSSPFSVPGSVRLHGDWMLRRPFPGASGQPRCRPGGLVRLMSMLSIIHVEVCKGANQTSD